MSLHPRFRLVSLAASLLFGAAIFASGAIGPLLTREVEAQSEPALTEPVAPPESAAGVPPDQAIGTTSTGVPLAATPAAPVGIETMPGDPGVPATDGGMTTNLGGSDVAVSSVGGSYEVDGPKRRADRLPRHLPRP